LLIAEYRSNAKITSIDISADMLKIAKDKIQKSRLSNIEIMQADASSTPFKDNSFDIVVLALVLHEIDTELTGRILREAYRVLKKKGCLLVLEWEKPQETIKKIQFVPIKMLEPEPFKLFIAADKKEYFCTYNFQITEEIHCDYSCVYKMGKRQGIEGSAQPNGVG
jgi:ubiquinone/menaquinone biosynthesis C-methylase UbiE